METQDNRPALHPHRAAAPERFTSVVPDDLATVPAAPEDGVRGVRRGRSGQFGVVSGRAVWSGWPPVRRDSFISAS
jgi:hypothetical protein